MSVVKSKTSIATMFRKASEDVAYIGLWEPQGATMTLSSISYIPSMTIIGADTNAVRETLWGARGVISGVDKIYLMQMDKTMTTSPAQCLIEIDTSASPAMTKS